MIEVFNEKYNPRKCGSDVIKNKRLYLQGYENGIKDCNSIIDGIIKILSEGREKMDEA